MRILFILVSLFAFSNLLAQNKSSQSIATLSNHLIEVNPEWNGKKLSQQTVSFEDENERIQFHLTQVLNTLHQADLKHLTTTQKTNRITTLETLEDYKERAVFPINNFLPIRNPIFKDQYQTACAVAHLMEATGAQKIVNTIQRNSNYDYIGKLAKEYPQVNNWADEHGFTLDELALIQPGYPPAHRDFYPIGNGGPVEGQINVIKSNRQEDLLILAGKFTEIDGIEAQNIIGWDGDSWVDMESTIVGEIHDLTFSNRLIAVGDFYLEDHPEMQNIAFWDNGAWHGLQTGDMEGSIKTIYASGNLNYIGGDFQKLNGEQMPYLAKGFLMTNTGEIDWNNDQEYFINSETIFVEDAFSVNGPVNVITLVEQKILIAGAFNKTAPAVNNSLIDQKDVNNVAFWFSNWFALETPAFNEIYEAAYLNNKIFLSDNLMVNSTVSPRVHTLTAGFWDERNFQSFNDTEDQRIHGFFSHEDQTFAFGNIQESDSSFVMINTAGFMEVGGYSSGGGILFDGPVKACEKFQDRIYFAGDFNHPEGEGLVSASLDAGVNITHDLGLEAEIQIFTNDKQLHIQYVDLKEKLSFSLYDFQGKLIDNYDLSAGSALIEKDLTTLPDGIYIYQLHNGTKMVAGRLSVF